VSLAPDDLLDALGAALRPPPVEPSPAELAALHRMIDERCDAPVITRVPAKRAWTRRPLAVIAATAGLVMGSGAAAFAAGAPVPRPIRAAAHDVGLPVDSPQLADTKVAASELRAVLAANDTATIKRVRARLHRKLAEVPGDERDEIERDAKALLARADRRLQTAHDRATNPAAGHDKSKSGKGGTGSGGSKSGSGSTSGSGSSGSGGAGAGSSGTGASKGSGGSGATSLPNPTVPEQPSGSGGSPLPAWPSLPATPQPPAVPPLIGPPADTAPVHVPPVDVPPVVAAASASAGRHSAASAAAAVAVGGSGAAVVGRAPAADRG
jgi:hypothetical protein